MQPTEPTPEKLYSVEATASWLDCSPKTVRRRIAAKKLAAVRDGGRLKILGSSMAEYISLLPSAELAA
jgi:excisionase family DNA binding protein